MIGSYYNVPPAMYRPPPPGTPGWQGAPVPGWGVNPWRAGPPRVGVGQTVKQSTLEEVALSVGWFMLFAGGLYGAWYLMEGRKKRA